MELREVVVYVEGESDKSALEKLLADLIERKAGNGVNIKIIAAPDGKDEFVRHVPIRAANMIHNPNATTVAVPDLYPPNKGFDHETCQELRGGLRDRFHSKLRNKGLQPSEYDRRFEIFCFKYDFEVLLLAATPALKRHLSVQHLDISWANQPENQNHEHPPKKVVERIFQNHGENYIETADAPDILADADLSTLKTQCPQCFAPFIDYLEEL